VVEGNTAKGGKSPRLINEAEARLSGNEGFAVADAP
jgi:hypothetical protein